MTNGSEQNLPSTRQPAPPPAPRAEGSALLGGWRLAGIFLMSVTCIALQMTQRALSAGETRKLGVQARWSRRWARRVLGWMGIRMEVEGEAPPPGCMIAPNHFTWLDVIALMSTMPSFFVSHAGVASWPVAGFFARGAGTVFIKRSRVGNDLPRAAGEIRRRLDAGQSVVVFLEGTTGDGRKLLPFRASLVQTAIEAGARVVPTALRWRAERPGISVEDDIGFFREDQVFAKQAWRLLKLRGVACEVAFGEPIDVAGRERKELTAEIEAQVRQALARLDGPTA